jgi:hypothetical protein
MVSGALTVLRQKDLLGAITLRAVFFSSIINGLGFQLSITRYLIAIFTIT